MSNFSKREFEDRDSKSKKHNVLFPYTIFFIPVGFLYAGEEIGLDEYFYEDPDNTGSDAAKISNFRVGFNLMNGFDKKLYLPARLYGISDWNDLISVIAVLNTEKLEFKEEWIEHLPNSHFTTSGYQSFHEFRIPKRILRIKKEDKEFGLFEYCKMVYQQKTVAEQFELTRLANDRICYWANDKEEYEGEIEEQAKNDFTIRDAFDDYDQWESWDISR